MEFSAKENMMGYITDAKNPTAGNAYNDIFAEPNNAALKQMSARMVKMTRTFRLSIIFNNKRPRIPPAVINPQKYATASAPVVFGS